MPFALGVTLSQSLLSGDPKVNKDRQQPQKTLGNSQQIIWRDTLADFSATLVGALFIAFSIAPTDEITVIAASASSLRLLMILCLSGCAMDCPPVLVVQ